jgi:hypothetical protein
MSKTNLLALIDTEITHLQAARALITGAAVKRKPGRPKSVTVPTAPVTKKKRKMSAATRAKIAAAAKARWAAQKKAAKAAK